MNTTTKWTHLQAKRCECDNCAEVTSWQECCEIDGKWVSHLCYKDTHHCLAEIAYDIYEVSGQDGVLKWARELPLEWAWCEPCEYESPIDKNTCLVCGTER